MAESKGFFGVLPYAFASLRSLTTDFQTVHRTVFIGKADRPCSNPLLSYQQKNKGYSKCYTLYSLAESKGFFGVLPYAFASLRSLTTDFQTVHRTVFIGKADRPCSNPLLSYQQKNKGYSKRYTLYSLAESKGFEPSKPFWRFTRFPIVLLRPARTTLHVTCDIIYDCLKKIKCELQ